jgi:CIC family chloride channel protein
VALAFFHLNGIAGDPYGTLTLALTGKMTVVAMLVFCVLKLAATVCSYSSGGAGGIFAPALFMGSMLGGSVGYLDVIVFHHSTDSIGAFAVVGMGAVFAGIVRAPMTSVLIIFEMTGGYGLVLPLMIANMSAFALARHWRRIPIYEALLAQDGIYLNHGPGPPDPPDDEELPAAIVPGGAGA